MSITRSKLPPLLALAACVALTACHQSPAPGAKAAEDATPAAAQSDAKLADGKDAPGAGVTLTAEQVDKLGVATQPAAAMQYTDETAGYGVVLSHDIIAQAAAELATAQATERLSRSALSRAQKLNGTPGAVSADVEETALQKAAVDAAALTLTRQKLSASLGSNPPWAAAGGGTLLQKLAGGRIKLVRVTFPLGALRTGRPTRLRAGRIGATGAGDSWDMAQVWDAPADANVPGRSFFALLNRGDVGEGERLQVWAPIGATTSGVVVPLAAAVLSDGKYWCYLEKKPGTFVRTAIDTSRLTAGGYFVTDGVAPGDPVVTASAGQLLAKESASGAEPD